MPIDNCNISSGRIRAALQGGPVVISGVSRPLRLCYGRRLHIDILYETF
jgi:hypothetical protein